jgi:hypothetical protein
LTIKKILLLSLVLSLGYMSRAQIFDDWYPEGVPSFFIGGGYGFMYANSTGLDMFIHEYNRQKRPILSKYMEKSSFSGLALSTGFFWNGLILELGYSTHSGTLIAEGNPAKIAPGSITHRKIDLDLHSINIMGALVYGFDPIYTGPFIEAAFTNIKFETEIEGRGLKRLDMDSYIGFNTGWLFIIGDPGGSGAYLVFKPYYSYSVSDPEWLKLYEATNTKPLEGQFFEDTKGAFNGFNMTITLNLNMACF